MGAPGTDSSPLVGVALFDPEGREVDGLFTGVSVVISFVSIVVTDATDRLSSTPVHARNSAPISYLASQYRMKWVAW